LEPGQGINEPDVASLLSVSRTPIREALLRLQREGLVDIRPQAGTFVTSIDWNRVEEGMIVREALEIRAIEAAAINLTDQTVEHLLDEIRRMELAADRGDVDSFMAADDSFHGHLMQASGYHYIPTIIKEVNGHLDRVRSLSGQSSHRMPQVVDEHREIIAQMQKGTPASSAEAMLKHLKSSWKDFQKLGRKNGLV